MIHTGEKQLGGPIGLEKSGRLSVRSYVGVCTTASSDLLFDGRGLPWSVVATAPTPSG